MSAYFSWFDPWRDTPVSCTCGWTGLLTDDMSEPFDALLEFSCPKCFERIALVSYPTDTDIEQGMKAGHPEAVAMWPRVLESRRRRAESDALELRDPAQLPELEGEALSFVFDATTENKRDWFIIRCGDRELWREHGTWEHWQRFNEVKDMLKARYAARFVRMDPTPAAQFILYGDRMSTLGKLEYT